jgi:hypothetical protein
MLLRGGSNHTSFLIDEKGARAARPNIYAENNHDYLSLKRPAFCFRDPRMRRRKGGKKGTCLCHLLGQLQVNHDLHIIANHDTA